MKKKFLAMYDHITDQGGSFMVVVGEIFIIMAIVFAVWYLAYFLDERWLRETETQEAERTLRWYAITNEDIP